VKYLRLADTAEILAGKRLSPEERREKNNWEDCVRMESCAGMGTKEDVLSKSLYLQEYPPLNIKEPSITQTQLPWPGFASGDILVDKLGVKYRTYDVDYWGSTVYWIVEFGVGRKRILTSEFIKENFKLHEKPCPFMTDGDKQMTQDRYDVENKLLAERGITSFSSGIFKPVKEEKSALGNTLYENT